jgi:hypothetical protein
MRPVINIHVSREGCTVSTNRRTSLILRDGVAVLELVLALLLEGDGLRGNSCGRFVG